MRAFRAVTLGAALVALSSCGHRGLLAEARGNETAQALAALEDGASVDERDASGRTALHYAVIHGNLELVDRLLEKGAQPNTRVDLREVRGFTPLHWIAAGHPTPDGAAIVRKLCKAGALVNAPTSPGNATPLLLAAAAGNVDVVKALVECGADLNVTAENGNSPVGVAASEGHLEITRFLLGRGAICPGDLCENAGAGSTALENPEEELKKFAGIVKLVMLAPVVTRLSRSHDPRIAALLEALEVSVPAKFTRFPNAWVDPKDRGRVHVDALYIYTRRDVLRYAGARGLQVDWADALDAPLGQYRSTCAIARRAGAPAPSFEFRPTFRDKASVVDAYDAALEGEKQRASQTLLAFVLLHEIAHQLESASDGTLPAKALESKADEWAFDQMNRLGYSLANLERVFNVEAQLERIREETGFHVAESHPSWHARSRALSEFQKQHAPPACDFVELRFAFIAKAGGASDYRVFELEFPLDPDAIGTRESALKTNGDTFPGVVRYAGDRAVLDFRQDEFVHHFEVARPLDHRSPATWTIHHLATNTTRPSGPVTVEQDRVKMLGPVDIPTEAGSPERTALQALSGVNVTPQTKQRVISEVRRTALEISGLTERLVSGALTPDAYDVLVQAAYAKQFEAIRDVLSEADVSAFRVAWSSRVRDACGPR